MLKKLVAGAGDGCWRARKRGRESDSRLQRVADAIDVSDDQDVSVHGKRHDVCARTKHESGGTLAALLTSKA